MALMKRFAQIALWKKFAGLGLLCLSVIALPTYLYWREVSKSLDFAAREQQGLPQVQLLLSLIQYTQQHRAVATYALYEKALPQELARQKAQRLEEAITAYDQYLEQHPNPAHRQELQDIVAVWHDLQQKVLYRAISAPESFAAHSALIARQLELLQTLVDDAQLSLDPEPESYFLIDASLQQLPALIEALGQVRGYSVGLLAKGAANAEERAHLKTLLFTAQDKSLRIETAMLKAFAARRQTGDELGRFYEEIKRQHQQMQDLTQQSILDQPQLSYSAEDFYNQFSLGLTSYFEYVNFSSNQIDLILSSRLDSKRNTMLALS